MEIGVNNLPRIGVFYVISNSPKSYLFVYKIWALDLSPLPTYGTLKFVLQTDSGRYLLADTSCPYILPCEVGSLCAQGFRRYGNLEFTIGKAYLFNIDMAWKSPWKTGWKGNAKDTVAYRDLRYSIGTHSIRS